MLGFRRLFVALAVVTSVVAIGSPFGFGRSTTGGAGGVTVTPTTNAELVSYLSDSTTRTIILTQIFDFTDYYGTTTGTICKPWSCSPNPQWMISTSNNFCSTYASTETTGTYYNSGVSSKLKVGSNKTILGKGSSAGIKGITLLIQNASNVIVQNISVTDINARYVWGGDAISIQGSSRVWIDHCYIRNIGRQFIVTGYDTASQVTISNNVFDGRATYSTGCDGHHYWVVIFAGNADTITFARNHVYYTAGRGPHIGGLTGSSQWIHIVNNYYDSIAGHAIDNGSTGVVLTEGNYFNSVTTPSVAGSGGAQYFISTSSQASTCTSILGRTCQVNTLVSSGSVSQADSVVLSTFDSQSAVESYTPMAASSVPAFVTANAGVGIIN